MFNPILHLSIINRFFFPCLIAFFSFKWVISGIRKACINWIRLHNFFSSIIHCCGGCGALLKTHTKHTLLTCTSGQTAAGFPLNGKFVKASRVNTEISIVFLLKKNNKKLLKGANVSGVEVDLQLLLVDFHPHPCLLWPHGPSQSPPLCRLPVFECSLEKRCVCVCECVWC